MSTPAVPAGDAVSLIDDAIADLSSRLAISDPPAPAALAAVPAAPAASAVSGASPGDGFDRWTEADPSTISYGPFSSSAGAGVDRPAFYLTTAINYTNGPGHMGHAYEAVTSDILARGARLCGKEVRFVTGSDEHGQKIAGTAEEQGVAPIAICDKYVTGFRVLNQRCLVSNDDYVRTTSARHMRTARELWRRCEAAGDIYLSAYQGWYNVREETFVPEKDAEAADYKDPASGLPLKQVSEPSYFFKMGAFHDRLVAHITENEEFIRPAFQRKFILSRLAGDALRDLSVSRTTFAWGIDPPAGGDRPPGHVMYVWFDALSNYLTGCDALGANGDGPAADAARFWPADVHVIGKDIIWFHAVIWPCILMSAGLPLPKTVLAHGFVNDVAGKKMSKSLGNVVDPHVVLDSFPVDSFRWYLAREATYGGELSFSERSLRDMHNADLCDTLGNLVHRATKLCEKYCGGTVPAEATEAPPVAFAALRTKHAAHLAAFELDQAASDVMAAFRDVNGYLTTREPWKMRGDDKAAERRAVVRTVLEAVYALAHLLAPFAPTGAHEIAVAKLGTPFAPDVWALDPHMANLTPGTAVTVGAVLYEKILSEEDIDAAAAKERKDQEYKDAQKKKKESKAKQAELSKQGQAKKGAAPAADQPDYTKMEIRVGKITRVWHHPDADRLYCEEIDVGEAAPRQIASGLRDHYTLEEMADRTVAVVCNLKASKILGFSSNGMVLAAKSSDGKTVKLVSPPAGAAVGERVVLEGQTDFPPLSSAQVKKKKVWETVRTQLVTADGGIATHAGVAMVTGAGPCTVEGVEAGAPIS